MSIKLKVIVSCDGCGALLVEESGKGTAEGYAAARIAAIDKCKRLKAMEFMQHWKPTLVYCDKCADSPHAKI